MSWPTWCPASAPRCAAPAGRRSTASPTPQAAARPAPPSSATAWTTCRAAQRRPSAGMPTACSSSTPARPLAGAAPGAGMRAGQPGHGRAGRPGHPGAAAARPDHRAGTHPSGAAHADQCTLRQMDEGSWLIGDSQEEAGYADNEVSLPILRHAGRPRRAHPAGAARGQRGALLVGAARDVSGRLSHLRAVRDLPRRLRGHLPQRRHPGRRPCACCSPL